MKTVLFCFSITAFLFVVILLIRRYKEKINRGDVSLLVDISTVLVGIATLIVSGISIHVMLSQEETQGLLVELQKREHQPIFSINYTLSKSPASEVYDVEDYVVENIGEQMLSPANISCKSFIKVDYSDVDAGVQKSVYYPLTYYYNATLSSGDQTGELIRTIGNEYLQNNLKLYQLHQAAQAYTAEHDKEYVFIKKIDLFTITYTDLYAEERTVYYRDGHLVTEEAYNAIFQNASDTYQDPVFTKSISEVTLDDLIGPLKGQE